MNGLIVGGTIRRSCLVTIVAIILFTGIAGSTTASEVIIGSAEVGPNEIFDIPVYLANVTNVTGLNFTLQFDSSVVWAVNVSPSPDVVFKEEMIDNSTGILRIAAVTNLTTSTSPISVLNITFYALDAGYTFLNLTDVEISDETFNVTAPDIVINGSVNVLPSPIVLTFVNPTPPNGTISPNTFEVINVTSNKALSNATINGQIWLNGVWGKGNESGFFPGEVDKKPMQRVTDYNWVFNITNLPNDLIIRYWVEGEDLSGNKNTTETRYLTIAGYAPVIEAYPPPSPVPQNAPAYISVFVFEGSPDTLKVFRNGTLVTQTSYQGFVLFNISIDTSQPGVWNYTIWANDTFGNANQTTLFIVVPPPVFFNVEGNAMILWNDSYANISVDLSLVADINGDGVDDLILLMSNTTPDGNTYDKMILFTGDGTKLWERDLGWFWAWKDGIAVLDLNNDGWKDIVATNEYQQSVIAIFGNNGTLFWNYTNSGWDWGPYIIITSDLDGDGIKDIVAIGDNYSVGGVLIAAIKSDGTELWTKPFEGWPSVTASIKTENQIQNILTNTIKVYGGAFSWNYDFNGDAKGDVLISGDVYINGIHYHGLEAVRGDNGQTLWKAGIGNGWLYPYSPVDDTNGDGIREVLVSYEESFWQDSQYVTIYRTLILDGSGGNELFNVSERLLSEYLDWDGDGTKEFFTYDGYNVYKRNADGSVVWSYALGNYNEVGATKGLVVYGFNHTGSNGSIKIVKLDSSGNEVWTLMKNYTDWESIEPYPVGDLNGDWVVDYACFSLWMWIEHWGYVPYVFAINGADGSIFWEMVDTTLHFIGDFDGDGKGDVFTSEYSNNGTGLRGDDLSNIFNVSSNGYLGLISSYELSTSNEHMGLDFNGDGLGDMAFILNPYSPNSSIYVVTVKQLKPDLKPKILMNDTVLANQQVEIKVNVTNAGSVDSQSTTLDLYIDGTKVTTLNVPALSAGATATFSYLYTFTEGQHEIRVVVDPGNSVDESNEYNNQTTFIVNAVALKPDLVISYIKAPAFVKKMKDNNVTVSAEFAIENIGVAPVTSPFVVRAWLGSNFADLNVNEVINPGDSIIFHVSVTVSPYVSGDFITVIGHNYTAIIPGNVSFGVKTVRAMVDADGVIDELNETNNNATVSSEVTRPDLIPLLKLPEFDILPPGTYLLVAGAVNLGKVDADPTLLLVEIEKNGEKQYHNTTFNLSAGQMKLFGFNHTFEAGIYNITIIANYNHATQTEPWDAELTYSNNTLHAQILVAPPSPVNVTVPSFIDVPIFETRNFTLIFESERVIKDFEMKLHYDPAVVMVVNVTPLLPNVTWDWSKGMLKGSNISLNGTFPVATITLVCVDDRGRESPLNLSGKFWDILGFKIPLNAINGTFRSLKITDLRPFIISHNIFMQNENNSLTVVVRNVRYVDSYNYTLLVYVANATTGVKVAELINGSMPALLAWSGTAFHLNWNASVPEGEYYLNATVYNDTIELNNNFSRLVVVKAYTLDAWRLYYPFWPVKRGDTFWISAYFSASVPGFVNATINVPDGLLVWNGSDWVRSDTRQIFAWPTDYNYVGWLAKGVKAGEYGNQTPKEINITVEGRGKSDTITTAESPSWKLIIVPPRIWVYHINSTVINTTSTETLLFKTVNVTTFDQRIRIALQAGLDGRVLTGLDYLVHYPYGCVEQTTSAMLGALHTDEYYRVKGKPAGYDFERVNESVRAGIERLSIGGVRGQHNNGSWSMWGNYPPGHVFYTVYGSYGLGRVKQDDYFGGNVSIGDNPGQVNFSKTVEWFSGKLIDSGNGSYWETWRYYPGSIRITAFGMITHYQMFRFGNLTDGAKTIANETMRKTTEYLVKTQNTSGGWGEIEESWYGKVAKEPDPMTTALAVWALKLYGMEGSNVSRAEIEGAIQNGMQWLINNQELNGSWTPYKQYYFDDYGLRSETTALVLLALNESDSISGLNFTAYSTYNDTPNATMKKGVNFLLSTYRQMGSWGYTRATQTALHALTELQPAFTSDVNVSIWVDGIFIGNYRVNETNPREIVDVNSSVISAVMSNTSMPAGGKRYWHTLKVSYTSGSGPVIVGVINRQFVDQDEVAGEIIGHKIKTLASQGVLKISRNLDIAQVGGGNEVDIQIITPDVEGDGVVKVIITNNNDSVLLSPIVEIPLASMTFNDTYPVNLTWANNSINPIPHEYDAANSTLRLFPDEVPARGSIVVWFNATINAGNNTFEARVTPMYNELVTYIKSVTKYIKGYGNVRVNVYNETGPVSTDFKIGTELKYANSNIKVLEGTYTLDVNVSGYVPISTVLSLTPGQDINITVKLYKPEELTEPKILMVEGDLSTLESSGSVLSNITVKPNAVTKAQRSFNMTIIGYTKKIVAVTMPKYVRGSLWAWLNDSISITVDGQPVTPEEVIIGNEKVLTIEIDGSASVNVSFKGRRLGDVYQDSKVNYKDAIGILQYSVLKNTSISKDLFTGKAVYGDVYQDSKVNYKDAIGILQYSVLKSTEFNSDLWT